MTDKGPTAVDTSETQPAIPKTEPPGSPKSGIPASPKNEAKSETQTNPNGETLASPKSEAKLEVQAGPKGEVPAIPKSETLASPNSETSSRPKSEANSETPASSKSDASASPKVETLASPKSDAPSSPKSETTTRPKTEANSETPGSPKSDAPSSPKIYPTSGIQARTKTDVSIDISVKPIKLQRSESVDPNWKPVRSVVNGSLIVREVLSKRASTGTIVEDRVKAMEEATNGVNGATRKELGKLLENGTTNGETAGNKSTMSTASKVSTKDPVCSPCDYVGEKVVANGGFCNTCKEFMCNACFSHHRKTRATRHHDLLDRTHMPEEITCRDTSCTEVCEHHKDQLVEFYCQTHHVFGCHVCTTLQHRTCTIDYIPEASSNFNEGMEYTSLIDLIDQLLGNALKYEDNLTPDRKYMNEMNKQAVDDVRRFKAAISAYLELGMFNLFDLTSEVRREDSVLLDTLQDECKGIRGRLQGVKDLLADNTKQLGDLFIVTKRSKLVCTQIKKDLEMLFTKTKTREYFFRPTTKVAEMVATQTPLGELIYGSRGIDIPTDECEDAFMTNGEHSTTEDNKHVIYKSLSDLKIAGDGKIHIRTSREKKTPRVMGLTVMDNELCITDYNNKTVKLVDILQRAVVDSLSLHSRPWDVTKIAIDQVAITLPESKAIQFIKTSTSSGKMSLFRSFKVTGSCYGIFFHGNTLIVTFSNPHKVEVISLVGEVIKSIPCDLGISGYVSADTHSNCFLVTCCQDNSVIRVPGDNNPVTKHEIEHLEGPMGLIHCGPGQFAVSNQASKSISLLQVDANSIVHLCTWDCVTFPNALSFSPNPNTLYVSSGMTSKSQFAEYIHVYKLK